MDNQVAIHLARAKFWQDKALATIHLGIVLRSCSKDEVQGYFDQAETELNKAEEAAKEKNVVY